MIPTPLTCWTCTTPHCKEYHTTKEEAASCSGIEPYTAYQCPVCLRIDQDRLYVEQCCDIEYHEKQLEFIKKESERHPGRLDWLIAGIRAITALNDCKQRVADSKQP